MEHYAADPPQSSLAPRLDRRDEVEQILLLAEYLPQDDRELIEAVYLHGRSTAAIARLARISQRTVQRRVQRTLKRMKDRRFAFVALRGQQLPTDLRGVARRLILEGRTLRDTARTCRKTLHQIREMRIQLLATIDAHIADP